MADENRDLPSLEALSRKIDQAKPPAEQADQEPNSDYAQAFRFTVELFSGVLVGGLIGYGLDRLFGSLPWATIVCIFLGMGAGIRNMMRSAKEIESKEQ